MTLCHNTPKKWTSTILPPYTSRSSIVATADRLQLALDNGLTIDKLSKCNWQLASAVVRTSLEPKQVVVLARLYGLQWSETLTEYAAVYKKYEVLKWLLKCGCPRDLEVIIEKAREYDDLEHTKQVYAITGPWPADQSTDLMNDAGLYNELDSIKWWRAQGVAWPKSFSKVDDNTLDSSCWSLRCVEWALANGSTWLEWRCQYLAPRHYYCRSEGTEHSDDTCPLQCDRKQAAELFQWAHENGCPCTCGEAAAAVWL